VPPKQCICPMSSCIMLSSHMHAAPYNPQHVPLHVICHVCLQASGDAAGGEQGSSSTAKALEDCTPQQVGGSSMSEHGWHS
jgi:hypothetical protein